MLCQPNVVNIATLFSILTRGTFLCFGESKKMIALSLLLLCTYVNVIVPIA